MNLTIDLSAETEQKLRACAAATGQDVAAYVRQLIEKAVGEANGAEGVPAGTGKSLAEILAPIHQDFRASGMTEEELEALIEECRQEVWQEHQARNAP